MRYAMLLLVILVTTISCASDGLQEEWIPLEQFDEPLIKEKGVEVYRLFWEGRGQPPIAIIVFKSSNSGYIAELKATDGLSTYRFGKLEKHYMRPLSLGKFRKFKRQFVNFENLGPDESDSNDEGIICLHPASYYIEVKSQSFSHSVMRDACGEKFERDIYFLKPFFEVAESMFKDDFSDILHKEYYMWYAEQIDENLPL